MRPTPSSPNRATPAQPLCPCELVTDDMLRNLARGEPDWSRGVLSDEVQAQLAMILPDLCGELLARRAADRADADRPTESADRGIPFPNPRNHAEEIANARAGEQDFQRHWSGFRSGGAP